jgi:hypothetical protein
MSDQLQVFDPAAVPGGKLSGQVPYSIFRSDEQGALMTGNLMGRYRENTHRIHNYAAATPAVAGQAVSVGLTATYTGLAIYNPAGSGIVASINWVSTALALAEVAISCLFVGGFVGLPGTITTAISPFSCSIGNASVGQVVAYTSIVMLAIPFIRMPIVGGALATALPATSGPQELAGLFELQPGNGACILAVTAVTGQFGFGWTEIPV